MNIKIITLILLVIYGISTAHATNNPNHRKYFKGSIDSNTSISNNNSSSANASSQSKSNNTLFAGDATGGRSSVTTGDTVVSTNYDDYPVSTASTIVPAACQTGSSVQGREVGIAIVSSDTLCDYYKAAEVSYKAFLKESAVCIAVCSVECTPDGYVYAEKSNCELADKYLESYHKNLSMAQELVESTEFTAKVDRATSGVSKILMFVLAFVWVL